MSYFEDLGKRIGSASKNAARKASALADSAGASMQVNALERDRDQIFRELGALYFQHYGTTPAAELVELCCAAAGKTAEIEAAKRRLQRLKHQKVCSSCGAANPKENRFCSKCGNPLEDLDENAEAPVETQPDAPDAPESADAAQPDADETEV